MQKKTLIVEINTYFDMFVSCLGNWLMLVWQVLFEPQQVIVINLSYKNLMIKKTFVWCWKHLQLSLTFIFFLNYKKIMRVKLIIRSFIIKRYMYELVKLNNVCISLHVHVFACPMYFPEKVLKDYKKISRGKCIIISFMM